MEISDGGREDPLGQPRRNLDVSQGPGQLLIELPVLGIEPVTQGVWTLYVPFVFWREVIHGCCIS